MSTSFEAVRALFARQQARGDFPGGQLVVRRGDTIELDVAIGVARGFRPEENEAAKPVTPSTRFSVFSASKAVLAVAIAMLEERGVIDVSAPVSRWFPDFGANGKAELTVLDVLTHRAGVFTPELLSRPHDWADDAKVRAALVDAKPRFPRGTLAYMPYEFGWILAEVVRGATGRRLDDFVRDEFGLPGLRYGATRDELTGLARTYWLGTKRVVVAGNELSTTFERDNNLPEVVTAFVPGAGLVCTAHDLAAFYAALLAGKLIRRDTLQRYAADAPLGFDRSNRIPMRMARGFMLGTFPPSIYGWWNTSRVFGHAGAFSALAYADPDRDLSVAIVTNGNRGPSDSLKRFAPIGSAIRKACR